MFGRSAQAPCGDAERRHEGLASAIGSKHQVFFSGHTTIVPMRGVSEGPAQLVRTAGHNTTTYISTLNNMLARQYLRAGDGIYATPDARRKERLLSGTGRLSLGSGGAKLSVGDVYDPRSDTCLEAFIRLIAACAEAQIHS